MLPKKNPKKKKRDMSRICPKCTTRIHPRRREVDSGVTWFWRCACGWAGVLAESGVVSRRKVKTAVDASRKGFDPDD